MQRAMLGGRTGTKKGVDAGEEPGTAGREANANKMDWAESDNNHHDVQE
jgi:hypothetical protein